MRLEVLASVAGDSPAREQRLQSSAEVTQREGLVRLLGLHHFDRDRCYEVGERAAIHRTTTVGAEYRLTARQVGHSTLEDLGRALRYRQQVRAWLKPPAFRVVEREHTCGEVYVRAA